MGKDMDDLRLKLREFAKMREWQQFHSPKNLAMALIAEAGELVEHFQWLSEEQSKNLPVEKREEVALELADVLIYLVRLADTMGIDLLAAADRKMEINAEKYPAELVKGSARKYTAYS